MLTLYSLPFLLPMFCMLQMFSGPLLGPTGPAVRDTFASDLE